MFEKKEKHESYGKISFSRCQNGAAIPLFGSSIKHRDTIVMRVHGAYIARELNNDYIFDDNLILEAEMSQTQFAEAITSMNSTGVPITLSFTQEKGSIEKCPYVDKKQIFEKEFSECQKENKEQYADFEKFVKEILEKKSIGKGDKEEILKQMNVLKGRLFANQEYVYKQFNEQMDKTTSEAKGEIEAFMQNKLLSIANAAIVENKELLQESKNPVSLG